MPNLKKTIRKILHNIKEFLKITVKPILVKHQLIKWESCESCINMSKDFRKYSYICPICNHVFIDKHPEFTYECKCGKYPLKKAKFKS